jgi:putative PIN family toxin of toxin-antitoxin system
VYSKALFGEVVEVLSRPKFAGKFSQEDVVALLRLIQQASLLIEVPSVEIVSRDPKDDPLLACAKAAEADYLVAGDEDLLCLQEHGKTKIVTPAQFVEILKSDS